MWLIFGAPVNPLKYSPNSSLDFHNMLIQLEFTNQIKTLFPWIQMSLLWADAKNPKWYQASHR